ncbi:MAG: PEP-CTERM sorting domain-containing protein [Planctomycetia bacterium]|nr:PEP-CTERM sorting domain-containing protein [Planctomycetia bacterium]
MKTGIRTLFAVLLSVAMVTGVQAGSITLGDSTLGDLLGEGPVGGAVPLMTTDMSNDILHAEVFSQAFATESGNYAYLYQVNNTGTGTNSSIELFTLVPFIGAGASPSVGWLTGAVPEGFLPNGQEPEDEGYINAEGVLSFYFTERAGFKITPGEHSAVLYAVSAYAPDTVELIVGNLIGARVGDGDVIGPIVPEPSTLVLIGMGLAALVVARRRIA